MILLSLAILDLKQKSQNVMMTKYRFAAVLDSENVCTSSLKAFYNDVLR